MYKSKNIKILFFISTSRCNRIIEINILKKMHPTRFKCTLSGFVIIIRVAISNETRDQRAINRVQSRDSSGGVFRFKVQSATFVASRFSSGVSCCSSTITFRFFAGCSSSSLEGKLSSSAVRLTGVSAPTECPPTAVFKNVHP